MKIIDLNDLVIWKSPQHGLGPAVPTQNRLPNPVIINDVLIADSFMSKKVSAFSKSSGDILWECPLPPYSGQAPIIQEDTVFVSGTRGVFAIDLKTGNFKWKFEYPIEDEGEFIYGSPLVAGDLLYFGDAEGCIRCLDIKSGAPLWKTETDEPIVSRSIYAFDKIWSIANSGLLTALDPKTGKILVSKKLDGGSVQPPLCFDHEIVIIGSKNITYLTSAGSITSEIIVGGDDTSLSLVDGDTLYCIARKNIDEDSSSIELLVIENHQIIRRKSFDLFFWGLGIDKGNSYLILPAITSLSFLNLKTFEIDYSIPEFFSGVPSVEGDVLYITHKDHDVVAMRLPYAGTDK